MYEVSGEGDIQAMKGAVPRPHQKDTTHLGATQTKRRDRIGPPTHTPKKGRKKPDQKGGGGGGGGGQLVGLLGIVVLGTG